jgi:hypothetical protein
MTLILSGTDGLSDVDGTAAAPAIRGTDANTGIFFGTDIIGFSEGGVESARFNADAQFVAASGTAALPVITTTGDVNTGIFFPAADTVAVSTGGTERARIESTGNFLVKRQITSFTTNGFGVFRSGSSLDVADGSTITLSSGSAAQLICVTCGTSGNGGTFFANYNVTVSQIGGSATQISTTDAGVVDIAVYKSINNNTVTFKNRSGFTKNYTISIFCADNGDTV